jgi:glycosyltransferase involved in cell wall biosynthesis
MSICLNMIVKDEAQTIPRLLRSVAPFVSYYVICDTGSTDGTPEVIEREAAALGMRGEIHRHGWQNFGHNRQLALDAAAKARKKAKFEWVLIIDADEELVAEDPGWTGKLNHGTTYNIERRLGTCHYRTPHLLSLSRDSWQWRGPCHNYLNHVNGPNLQANLEGAWIHSHYGEGGKNRQDPRLKYFKDALLLTDHLATNPDDVARTQFYLAQSYRDAGLPELALKHYRIRADMAGTWDEERYYSMQEIGRLLEQTGAPRAEIVAAYLLAFEFRPTRAECLFYLANYLWKRGDFRTCYMVLKQAAEIPKPDDVLFVRSDLYEVKIAFFLANTQKRVMNPST